MASVALIVRGAIVNAQAFSGSNYLFSKLKHGDAAEERKRHEKAMEQLQTARDAWSQKRTERLDWIKDELSRQNHAVLTFHNVEAAMREYARLTGETLDPLGPEPQLSDSYTPSSAQKDREISFVVGGMVVTGLVTYYIAKRQIKGETPNFFRSIYAMGLPEELYFAILSVGHSARRHKIPGFRAVIDIAQTSLEIWRSNERAAISFAAEVLTGPTNLLETTGQLPEPLALECWRLVRLLEYMASHVNGLSPVEDLLQPQWLLVRNRRHQEAGVCSGGPSRCG